MKIFLITTDHFLDRLWFKDDEDFRAAMNYIAVVSILTDVTVLAFVLMSNHVHIVLHCLRADAKLFIDTFKKLYGSYFCRKNDVDDYFRRLNVDIREVLCEDEALERVIAYVQMNCVAANICSSPFFYPWGSGACFFNEAPRQGNSIGSYSRRAQIRMIRSKVKLPDHYLFNKDGYVLPESYINTKGVEALFRSPKRYNFFLNASSKARKILDKEAFPSFRDQTILASANDLCKSLFRADNLNILNNNQKAELLKQLRYRFSADVNQLCRVAGLSYDEAAKMLDY